jgi:Tol biopolymer transport system component
MRHCNGIVGAIVALAFIAGCTPRTAPRVLLSFASEGAPAWSPQGDTIAFIHTSTGIHDPYPPGIYFVAAAGGPRRLVHAGTMRSVHWSPDARRLVYDDTEGLHVCTTTGDSTTLVYSGEAYFPRWSRGDVIAFDDLTDVWVLPVGRTASRLQLSGLVGARDPDWSPDGNALVVLGRFSGTSGEEVATIRSDGVLIRRLTFDAHEDRSPAWSPDGNRIAWDAWPQGAGGAVQPVITVIDTSGSARAEIYPAESALSWSPNSARLVFSKPMSDGGALYTIPAAGGAPQRIIQ